MYTFEDRLNGESLTLRPEATAGIVRAAIEHNLLYERPQRVWTRRPDVPPRAAAEGPLPAVPPVRRRGARVSRAPTSTPSRSSCWRGCGATLGLADGIRAADQLDRRRAGAPRAPRRADRRTSSATRSVARRRRAAPAAHESAAHPRQQEPGDAADDRRARRSLIDHLGDASRAHFDALAAAADRRRASRYTINPRLVRGLDYYNRTVFEWVTDRLGAQGTVAGGGRYDGLFEPLGGKPTPATRLRDRRRAHDPAARRMPAHARADAPLAYVVHAGERAGAARAPRRRDAARCAAARSSCNAGGGSFKSQMKKSRCERRALRAHHRRRRGGRGHRRGQAAARRRRAVRRAGGARSSNGWPRVDAQNQSNRKS